jgi:biotin synthase
MQRYYWPTRLKEMNNFLNLAQKETPVLLESARKSAALLPLSFAATVLINGNCQADPPCRHCRWRSGGNLNTGSRRIPSTKELEIKARAIKEAGAQRILCLSGWMGPDLPDYFYDGVKAIKEESGLEVCGGFGYTSRNSLSLLKAAGMDSYFCGLEIPNKKLFTKIRPGDSFTARL